MRRFLAAALATLFALPAFAAGPGVTLIGPDNQYIGTSSSPIFVQMAAGGSFTTTDNQGAPNTAANAWPFYLVQGGNPLAVGNPIFVQETTGNLAAILARTPALGPAAKAASQPVTIATDQGNIGVADPNNAAYTTPGAAFAAGTTVAAGRALLANCPSGTAGTLTLQLSGSANTVPYQVTAGTTVIPFAVVQVTAGVTGCTYQNLIQ